MKLTILGTGNAMVTKCYNTCFAIENDGHYFLVDGGGGNTIMKQLKNADIDWKEITDVFVTHKHVDHIMGIVWIMRLFGQNIAEKGLTRELNIYGHEEVIHILHSMAELLLQKKHCAAIGKQIHMIKVKDGEEKEILGHKVTFLISSPQRQSNSAFLWIWEMGKNLPAAVTNHLTLAKKLTPETANGSFTKHSVSMGRLTNTSHIKSIIPQ